MSGKFNNRTLLIVFLGLAGILVLTRVFTAKKAERTLDADLVEIDTGRISTIYIYPQAEKGSRAGLHPPGLFLEGIKRGLICSG